MEQLQLFVVAVQTLLVQSSDQQNMNLISL